MHRSPDRAGSTWSRPARLASLCGAALLLAAAGGIAGAAMAAQPIDPLSSTQAATRPLAILPMAVIGAHGVGTFSDPYPVHLEPALRDRVAVFSGTTKAAMHCLYPISAGCFAWTPLTIDSGSLGAEIDKAEAHVTNFQNLNVHQDDRGGLHAVLAIGVDKGGTTPHWTVLVHAHPVKDDRSGGLPLQWSADTVLSGSFPTHVAGNHDVK